MKNLKGQTAMYKKLKINRLIDLNSSLNLLSTLEFFITKFQILTLKF